MVNALYHVRKISSSIGINLWFIGFSVGCIILLKTYTASLIHFLCIITQSYFMYKNYQKLKRYWEKVVDTTYALEQQSVATNFSENSQKFSNLEAY